MNIKIDSLIPFDTLLTNPEQVFSVVEKNGKVILLKDNKPVYIVLKYNAETINTESASEKQNNNTLQEAMKIVLYEADDKTMHASKLADEIYERRLYLQKNGKKAQYTQIRARCGHYPDMFEALLGNFIKLKEKQNNGGGTYEETT
ncbi:MAG: hypothetical protein CVU87_01070 [Firmicutes bacterium HGW-Firmicutes-12]|jgi:antitoxin Phd|nr:MAG: hypothetical protein CVU87_01070 [Firmicutes bacterium HGW-Firmicutes-12]